MAKKLLHNFRVPQSQRLFAYSIVLLGVLWTLIVVIAYAVYQDRVVSRSYEFALLQVRSAFANDALYRNWSTLHGGTYVQTSGNVKPAPDLEPFPERDIVTTSGKKFTFVNPLWVATSTNEVLGDEGGVLRRIVSEEPQGKGVVADEWEKDALNRLKNGEKEYYSILTMKGAQYLRYMKPFSSESSCLHCHSDQDYLQGGLSITLPIGEYSQAMQRQFSGMKFVFGALLLGGWGWLGSVFFLKTKRLSGNTADDWQNTVDLIPDCISVHDEEHKVVKINASLSKLLGKERNDLIGKDYFEELSFDNLPHHKYPVSKDNEQDAGVTDAIVYFEDRNAWIEVKETSLYDDENKFTGCIRILRDVTDFVEKIRMLEEGEVRYQSLFNNAPLAYQSIGEGGTLQGVNKAWFEMMECRKGDDVIGRAFESYLDPESVLRFENALMGASKNNDLIRVDLVMVTRSKQNVEVLLSGRFVKSPVEGKGCLHCILIDISHLKKHEKLLEEYNSKLEENIRAKIEELDVAYEQLLQKEKLAAIGKLSGIIAHDIRNPLGAISNSVFYFDLKFGKNGDEKVSKYISLMRNEINRIELILTNLTELTVIDEKAPVLSDFHVVVRNVISGTIIPESIKVVTGFSETTPEFRFDQTQMQKVIDHLLSNAIEAIEGEGEISVITSYKDEHFSFAVKDNGIGIEEHMLGKIFEPLVTTKRKKVGFGLCLVKSIVEGHGGEVVVESEPGTGSIFRVMIPLS